jgi:hypothetical protein
VDLAAWCTSACQRSRDRVAGHHLRQGSPGRHRCAKKKDLQVIGKSRGGWKTRIHLVAADVRTAGAIALSLGGNDHTTYKRRNEVERLFRCLKGYRRSFSRFEKIDVKFVAFIGFALTADGLR